MFKNAENRDTTVVFPGGDIVCPQKLKLFSETIYATVTNFSTMESCDKPFQNTLWTVTTKRKDHKVKGKTDIIVIF